MKTKLKKCNTIEQIAAILLKEQITFEYSNKWLHAGGGVQKIASFTASYHSISKKLILMDDAFKEITLEQALREI